MEDDQIYSCGICNAKNLIPNKENEIDHACLNGLSIFIDKNFVLRPQMIDPETGHLISIRNEECEEVKEYHEPNEQYSSCKNQENSVVERNSGKKRSKLKTEIESSIWTGEHITYLIQLVRDNEIIWNYYIPLKERSKLQVGIAWDLIVEELKSMFPEISSNFNPIVVQAKWKSLVDYFWRKVASRPKTTGSAAAVPETWPYFKNMTFLQDIQNQKLLIISLMKKIKKIKLMKK